MTFDAKEKSVYDGAPVEIYRFVCGGSVWTWTSGDTTQVYQGATYEPETIERGEIDQNGEDEQGQLELTVARTNPVADLFIADLPVRPVMLEAFRLHRGDAEVVRFFSGEVASAEFQGSRVKLVCLPASQAFRRRIPGNTFQTQCNWAHYSPACGVNKDLHRVTGTVTAIAGVTIQAAAFATQPNGYFTAGWVETAAGETHWVTAHAGAVLTLMTPFRELQIGDTVHAFRGCDRTITACKAFNNLARYAGFPFVPTRNPFDVGVG